VLALIFGVCGIFVVTSLFSDTRPTFPKVERSRPLITPSPVTPAIEHESSTLEKSPGRASTPSFVPGTPLARPRAEFEKYMSVEESKREAVRRFPDLGMAESKANLEFIRRYHLYQRTRPEFFRQSTWPLRLAEEVATGP
jgi:hypothetical protein